MRQAHTLRGLPWGTTTWKRLHWFSHGCCIFESLLGGQFSCPFPSLSVVIQLYNNDLDAKFHCRATFMQQLLPSTSLLLQFPELPPKFSEELAHHSKHDGWSTRAIVGGGKLMKSPPPLHDNWFAFRLLVRASKLMILLFCFHSKNTPPPANSKIYVSALSICTCTFFPLWMNPTYTLTTLTGLMVSEYHRVVTCRSIFLHSVQLCVSVVMTFPPWCSAVVSDEHNKEGAFNISLYTLSSFRISHSL